MVSQSAPGGGTRVVIYAAGSGGQTPGDGGWGAVLTHGASQREVSGAETGATPERMSLLAVINALECLTRPASVLVLTDSEPVRSEVAERRAGSPRRPGPDDDLWARLAAASKPHDVEWVAVAPGPYTRAAELARRGGAGRGGAGRAVDATAPARPTAPDTTSQAAAPPPSSDVPSVDAALTTFVADQREHASPRAAKQIEDVVGALRWSIGWYEDQSIDVLPVTDIVGLCRMLLATTMPHKMAATSQELETARRVLETLLTWLGARGYLDAQATTSAIEDISQLAEDEVDVREFVEELRFWVEDEADNDGLDTAPAEERIQDEHLTIVDVTEDTITFEDDAARRIGPINVPTGIAEQAETGWRILLSAVRVNGAWRLRQVVSGDPA